MIQRLDAERPAVQSRLWRSKNLVLALLTAVVVADLAVIARQDATTSAQDFVRIVPFAPLIVFNLASRRWEQKMSPEEQERSLATTQQIQRARLVAGGLILLVAIVSLGAAFLLSQLARVF